MPRKSRDNIKAQYFHVMVQGINKSYIFDNDENAKKYIELLYKIKNEYDMRILTYCVMSNHCHILLNCKNIKDISSFMKKLNLNYAIYYNKKYNRVGYVFRDRFKSQAIISEKHLYNCIHYIYNNPVKAKICKEPKDYPYLKYEKNMGKIDKSFEFVEIENEKEDEIILISKYMQNKKMNFSIIKKDKTELVKLIKYLREKNNTSYRKMEKIFGMSREKIRKLAHK